MIEKRLGYARGPANSCSVTNREPGMCRDPSDVLRCFFSNLVFDVLQCFFSNLILDVPKSTPQAREILRNSLPRVAALRLLLTCGLH